MLTQLTRPGRIFVASRNGIRHSPEEHSSWLDIEAGSNLHLHTLLDVTGFKTGSGES